MSSSDEESDNLASIAEVRDYMLNMPRSERMQVSAWDDDDDGIEAERNAKDPDEKSVLEAAENGNLDNLRKLIAKNKHLLECRDKDGYTPLHRASYAGHVDIVEYLLQAGASTSSKTMDNWEPLHSACCWNNVECAAVLIANGADINAKSAGDQTPLHLVCASSHNSQALQLLLLHPDTNPKLVNSGQDTAEQIARRTGKYYPMFEIIEDCLNVI
ncbi:ankyrin repeat domain-containing protein 49 [Augochlora pura]